MSTLKALVLVVTREIGAQECTIALGLGAAWYGLSGYSVSLAWTAVGAVLLALAWPLPLRKKE